MTKAIFQAGLNWRMIENKWPNFRKAFDQFSAKRVSSFGEKEVKALMGDTGIVRNERKIRSVIENARESMRLKDEFGPSAITSNRSRETSGNRQKTCNPGSSIWVNRRREPSSICLVSS